MLLALANRINMGRSDAYDNVTEISMGSTHFWRKGQTSRRKVQTIQREGRSLRCEGYVSRREGHGFR